MDRILIVDDESHIRNLLSDILEIRGYQCHLAASAAEARELLKNNEFSLVLSDINMPGESGLDLVRFMVEAYPLTATVMVSAIDDPLLAEDALKAGVYDYITKPFEMNGVLISVSNALRRRELEIENKTYQEGLEKQVAERSAALMASEARLRAIFEATAHVAFILVEETSNEASIVEFSPGAERLLGFSAGEVTGKRASILGLPDEMLLGNTLESSKVQGFAHELKMTHRSGKTIPVMFTVYPVRGNQGDVIAKLVVIVDISERKKVEHDLEQSMKKLGSALEGTIQAVTRTVETRDPYTAGHQQRVAELAAAIGTELSLSEKMVKGLHMAGLIHDLGKVAIPSGILSKPGRITNIEFALIKTHPRVGYEILKDIEFPWPIAKVALQHHERIDGTGYPFGLSGDKIILEARILAVADVVEAMASHRPYRSALGIEKALEEISENRGCLYDEAAVDACINLFTKRGYNLNMR
ncbi:MAG TPA: response regulator [Desulfobacteraceae bacterium]|nr:response regulator [Desulfobacteraceae bacterium]